MITHVFEAITGQITEITGSKRDWAACCILFIGYDVDCMLPCESRSL